MYVVHQLLSTEYDHDLKLLFDNQMSHPLRFRIKFLHILHLRHQHHFRDSSTLWPSCKNIVWIIVVCTRKLNSHLLISKLLDPCHLELKKSLKLSHLIEKSLVTNYVFNLKMVTNSTSQTNLVQNLGGVFLVKILV